MNRTLAALSLASLSFLAPLSAMAATPAAPLALRSGAFTTGAHTTTGTATVYKLADGSEILRLTNFSTSNGPKVHVVLTDHAVTGNDVTDDNSVDLGDLKGTEGNQNYRIPAGTDVRKIRAVSIYCERFHVNFGAATLK